MEHFFVIMASASLSIWFVTVTTTAKTTQMSKIVHVGYFPDFYMYCYLFSFCIEMILCSNMFLFKMCAITEVLIDDVW